MKKDSGCGIGGTRPFGDHYDVEVIYNGGGCWLWPVDNVGVDDVENDPFSEISHQRICDIYQRCHAGHGGVGMWCVLPEEEGGQDHRDLTSP